MAKKKPAKKPARKPAKKPEPEARFQKISSLTKAQLAALKLDELWVMSPGKGRTVKVSLCGCRNVCLA